MWLYSTVVKMEEGEVLKDDADASKVGLDYRLMITKTGLKGQATDVMSADNLSSIKCWFSNMQQYKAIFRVELVECKVTNPVHVVLNKVVLELPPCTSWHDSCRLLWSGADESEMNRKYAKHVGLRRILRLQVRGSAKNMVPVLKGSVPLNLPE
ncbi:hypothetical protein Tco_1103068 [Tanacetum coccineum]